MKPFNLEAKTEDHFRALWEALSQYVENQGDYVESEDEPDPEQVKNLSAAEELLDQCDRAVINGRATIR